MNDNQLKLINEYMEKARLSFCCDGIGDKFNPDSNSAWEVVQEMKRKMQWYSFFLFVHTVSYPEDDVSFLMNPKNFFNCFSMWLEGQRRTNTVNLPLTKVDNG